MASPKMYEVDTVSRVGLSRDVRCTLKHLECVERDFVLTSFSKDQMKRLELELGFLKTIFRYEYAHHLVDENMMDLLNAIRDIAAEAEMVFTVARKNGGEVSFDSMLRDILENIQVVKVRYLVQLLSPPSGYRHYMDPKRAEEFLPQFLEELGSVLRSKEDLFSPVEEEIESLEKRLRVLEDFLDYIHLCIYEEELLSDLSSQIAIVIDHVVMACISFFFWTEKTTPSVDCRAKLKLPLSRLVGRMKTISSLELNEIFAGFCTASNLIQSHSRRTLTNIGFVSFLVKNLTQLLDTKRLQIPAVMDLVEALRVDPHHSILMHIEAVKNGIVSFYDEEKQKDVQIRDMKSVSIPRLQDDVNLIYKEVIGNFEVLDKTGREGWMVHPSNHNPLQCLEWQAGQHRRNMFHHILNQLKLQSGYVEMCLKQLQNESFSGDEYWYIRRYAVEDMHNICIAIKYGMLDGAYFYLSALLLSVYFWLHEDGHSYMLNNDEAVVELLGFLLGNLRVLLNHIEGSSLLEDIKILVEKLRFLRDVVNFVSEEKLEQDTIMGSFLNQIKTLCIEAIPFCFQWFIHKEESRMKEFVFYLRPKINEIEKGVKEISFNTAKVAVQSSNSETSHLKMIELVMLAIYSVREEDVGKLLNSSKSSWMIPLKGRIESLHKGMKLIWGFPKHVPEQLTEHQEFSNLFTSIAAFAIKTQSLFHYTYPDTLSQAMAKEVDSVLLDLIVAMKLINAQFTLMEMETLNSKPIVSSAAYHTELKFLITYLIDLSRQYINHDKHSHTLIKVVASEAEDVIRSHFTNDKLEGLLPLFLIKIKLIHAKVSLVEVLNCKAAGLTVVMMNGVETLVQEFEFMDVLLADLPKEYYEDEKLNNLVALVDKVATEAGSIISSTSISSVKEMNQFILGLLGKIAAIKMADRENFPKVSRSRFPKPYIMGFVEFVIGKIKDLLQYKPDLVSSLGNEIQTLQVELEFLITSLGAKQSRNEELTSLWAHIADVAYKVEHAIDSFISSKDGIFWKDMLSVCITEINLLKMEVTSVNVDEELSTSPVPTKAANGPDMNEVVVGFEDEEEKIKEKLTGEHSELDVVSIVGMPGLGKTTLAKKIYNYYYSKATHFDVCSSCCVSQAYEKKELLLDLLSKSVDNLEDLSKKSEGDLCAKLQKSLKGKRYLIFMDDIWSKHAWDDLKPLFPQENNRSRIILTTRLEEVASYATECSKPHHLRLLKPDESWSLLQRKIFQNETCPEKLQDVGKIIAERCKGLPLSIILIAGLLQNTVKERHWWESVAESVSSHFDTSLGIVELSYKHLPPYLKPCFLYFGGFQEDEEVPVSKLIWLWLAEGFIQEPDDDHDQAAIRSPELAQNYLMDLVGRSLVMKTKTAYDGKIKSCHVHDLIHEFCRTKAREENFLLQINGNHHVDSPHCYSKKPAQRRLSIFSTRDAFEEWNPSNSPVRSLAVKVTSNDMHRSKNHDVSSILQSFNLLRVLDLQNIYMATFPEQLLLLIHLSYLALRTGANSIPSSISNLWNLQTFIFKGQRGEVCLPESLWNMVHLKNVQINDRASLGHHKYRPEFFEKSVQLAKLENFSTPSLSYGDDMEKIIRRLFNLRKLRCRFSESWGYSKKHRRMCNRFPVLNDLGELESLKVLYNSRQVLHPCEFNFPSNLKKLTLSSFRLPWSEISQLGALQNLEVLKLVFRAFEGEEWTVGDEEFPKLKLLHLDNLNLVRWNVSADNAFPCLQQLVLVKCNKIEEMPTRSLEDNICLCSIEVRWCSRSAAIAVKEIQENRSDLGDDSLCVLILPPDWDSRT